MRWTSLVIVSLAASSALAQHYNDGQGKEWRSVPSTLGLSWNQIATVCPTDGATPCSGIVSGRDMNGWRWATQDQVRALFATFAPDIMTTPCVGGSQYAAVGIYALGGGVITPTWSAYTTFGGSLYVNGWTATAPSAGQGGLASASANYPVFDGSFCVTGSANAASVLNFTGVWMWRPVGCTLPAQVNGPATARVCAGRMAEFSVEASSGTAMTYQWRRDGVPLDTETHPSASTSMLSLVVSGATSAGRFDCVISNACGSVLSTSATLIVADFCCDSIDFNGNGVYPEDQDVIDFLSVLAGATCEACGDIDFNNNNVYPEDQDVIDFFNVLAGGMCS
ncbi:MAG TPA: hypothetical protein VK157_13750 [Phycisphaerales bacterium]|nr:hypothetical protein [Phycisphaerales bacterium]